MDSSNFNAGIDFEVNEINEGKVDKKGLKMLDKKMVIKELGNRENESRQKELNARKVEEPVLLSFDTAGFNTEAGTYRQAKTQRSQVKHGQVA